MKNMLFSEWLNEHARGDLDQELGDALLEVAEGVLMVDKKAGSVVLTVSVTKSGRMVMMSGEVKTKIPKAEAEQSMFYLSEGGLTKDDPYQLKAFDTGNHPLYEVDKDGALVDLTGATDDPTDPEPMGHD